tara:strand:+ start:1982 stop:2509 length:528 start_codon:yes stop_codon:yes gene_type:complete
MVNAMNYVNYADKKRLAGIKGFDDKEQRDAFKRMVKTCPVLYKYLYEYFNIDPNKNYRIEVDPLGEMKVDLGIRCTDDNTIVGLVEVDYYKKWNPQWPSNYRYCNRLARKEKYYKEHDYPYVNITFNVGGTSGIMTTREIEQRYSLTEWYVPEIGKYDKGRRIRLEDAIKIGEWA